MAINKLTEMAVRNARPRSAPYKLTDGEGLHLLVSTAGGRLWKLAYRYQGKQKTLALGSYPTVSLAEARAGRDGAKKLLHEGRDPSFAKRLDAERQANEDASVFRVVAKSWFAARIHEVFWARGIRFTDDGMWDTKRRRWLHHYPKYASTSAIREKRTRYRLPLSNLASAAGVPTGAVSIVEASSDWTPLQRAQAGLIMGVLDESGRQHLALIAERRCARMERKRVERLERRSKSRSEVDSQAQRQEA